MATFFDNTNNFILRDVPKGGGTTIRNWIGYYMTGELKLVASDPTKDFYYNDDSVARAYQNKWICYGSLYTI